MYSERDIVASLVTGYLRLKEMESNIQVPEKVESPVYFSDFRHYRKHIDRYDARELKKSIHKHQTERIERRTKNILKQIKEALPASQVWFQVDADIWVGWQDNDWPGDDGTLMISRKEPTSRITFRTTT